MDEFENWLYSTDELEGLLGEEQYFDLISADYSNARRVWDVKYDLRERLPKLLKRDCPCDLMRDLTDVSIDSAISDTIDAFSVVETTPPAPHWWLSLRQCKSCSQFWMWATDTRVNDVILFRRISTNDAQRIRITGVWPEEFSTYARVLKIGKSLGHQWRYLDPLNSLELYWTVVDLAQAEPGIAVSEIARLLPVSLSATTTLADKAVRQEGINIDLTK